MEPLGKAGEACRACGHPLAADQRYCLNCGSRRAGPRIDFRQHLPAEAVASTNGEAAPPQAAAPAPPPPDQRPQRDYAPLAAVGGIAVLGLMLLVGVLIGKGDGATSTPPPPQIVRLGDGGEATGGAAEAGDAGTEAPKGAKAKASAKEAGSAGSLTGGKSGDGPVEASDEALQELQEQSPEEYQESSARLPDEIATGGPPPPKDDKAPGGGSKGTAIE
jgi:hypothetical protein